MNPVWNDRPSQATIYSTLVGRGYQEERGMGNAEWPLQHVARHLFVWQARGQPIDAPVYILVSVPYTFGSTQHDGTIEAHHG